MRRLLRGVALLILMSAAACMNINAPTPVRPTATLPPLATFTPRFTATPIPTASPRPTFTHTPSPSPIPPTPSDTPTPTPTPPVVGRVSTAQDAIRMREGPGVEFPIIQGVPNNTELIVLASNEDQTWFNIRLEDGTEGWVFANLVYLPPTAVPEPTNTVPGVVVEISGTPLATALLGGQPITATPSFTPTMADSRATLIPPTLRTPGTVTTTPLPSPTRDLGALIPTVTPGLPVTVTQPAVATTPAVRPTLRGNVQPVQTGYDVLAYCNQFNEVPPPLAAGTTVDIFWGWVAATQEYLQQHLNNVIYEVRLDGRLLDNWRLYAGESRQQPDGNWAIYWYVPIAEPLSTGFHEITYRVSWRNPIFDGYKQFGPGTPNETETGNCTFEIR